MLPLSATVGPCGKSAVSLSGDASFLRARAALACACTVRGLLIGATEDPMITLELTPQDASFLAQHIGARIDHIQHELVHTDDRALHRAIADDLARLEALRHRLARVAAKAA